MPYIGIQPLTGRFAIVDQISGGFNGINTQFRIRVGGLDTEPGQASNMAVFLNGSGQTPSGNATYNSSSFDFSVDGSILTFVTPPPAGTTFYGEIFGSVLGIGQPSDNTVVPASITTNENANFVFPADITATGDIAGVSGIFTVLSGSTEVFGGFVLGTSGEFGSLDVINKLTVKDLELENDVTVSGDLTVIGNYLSVTGNMDLTSGTITAKSGTITGLKSTTINTQNITAVERVKGQRVEAVSGQFTTNLSGNFVQGPTISGENLVTAPSGVFTNISGNELHINELTVTGKITLTGVNVSGIIGGNLHVSGLFAHSGFFEETLSGATITGGTVNATTGNFVQLNAENFNPTTIEAVTGIFTNLVSGVSGVFDNLNFNGTVESKTGVFTETLSGATITGDTINATNINATLLTGEVITATQRFNVPSVSVISGSLEERTVVGRTGISVTTSGVIIFGPVTILP